MENRYISFRFLFGEGGRGVFFKEKSLKLGKCYEREGDETKQQGLIVAEEITGTIYFTGRDKNGKSVLMSVFVMLHRSLFLKIYKVWETRKECEKPFP